MPKRHTLKSMTRWDFVTLALIIVAVPFARSLQFALDFVLMSSPVYDNEFIMATSTLAAASSFLAIAVPTWVSVRRYGRRTGLLIGGFLFVICLAVLLTLGPVLVSCSGAGDCSGISPSLIR